MDFEVIILIIVVCVFVPFFVFTSISIVNQNNNKTNIVTNFCSASQTQYKIIDSKENCCVEKGDQYICKRIRYENNTVYWLNII